MSCPSLSAVLTACPQEERKDDRRLKDREQRSGEEQRMDSFPFPFRDSCRIHPSFFFSRDNAGEGSLGVTFLYLFSLIGEGIEKREKDKKVIPDPIDDRKFQE